MRETSAARELDVAIATQKETSDRIEKDRRAELAGQASVAERQWAAVRPCTFQTRLCKDFVPTPGQLCQICNTGNVHVVCEECIYPYMCSACDIATHAAYCMHARCYISLDGTSLPLKVCERIIYYAK
jgi:hypothetical protein